MPPEEGKRKREREEGAMPDEAYERVAVGRGTESEKCHSLRCLIREGRKGRERGRDFPEARQIFPRTFPIRDRASIGAPTVYEA